MTTSLEQQRDDAALGAAWRRAEAALPPFHGLSARRCGTPASEHYHAFADDKHGSPAEHGSGDTPTAALAALAEALESRPR